jgi:hypothetical protein
MKHRLLFLLVAFSLSANPQAWSPFLDSSRAIDWTSVGFTIPNYTTNCSTQPSLTANDPTAAAANTTAIQNALLSCDATHNVVNIPAGTYYVAGWTYGSQGKQVVRGAGPNSTYIYLTSTQGCGFWEGVCMGITTINPGFSNYLPGGTNACNWIGTDGVSGTYTQGSTHLLFQNCGNTITALTAGSQIFLDQANDITDTGGVYICNSRTNATSECALEDGTYTGRNIGGVDYSQIQIATVQSVTDNGGTPETYTVVISPGVYFNNIRTSQSPGAWWGTLSQNNGLENITIDQGFLDLNVGSTAGFQIGNYIQGLTSATTAWLVGIQSNQLNIRLIQGSGFTNGETIQQTTTRGGAPTGTTTINNYQETTNPSIGMITCNQCWVRNVRSMYGGRNQVWIVQSPSAVVRDSYFYQAQGYNSQSYAIEFELSSRSLIENNIFQQTTAPIMFGQGTGNVIGYNYVIDNVFGGPTGTFMMLSYSGHNAANNMNLWEGNNLDGINCDSIHGSSVLNTYFRNMVIGWQMGKLYSTYPISLEPWCRGFNVVGNVMGQPGYHSNYESYATAYNAGVNSGDAANVSIYDLGWTGWTTAAWPGIGGCGAPWAASPPAGACDPVVRPTLMRWGNWDTVTNGVKWNSTEASPAAVAYVNANFTSAYFDSLADTLPASLYYASKPSWWPSTKAWPPVGPDVSGANLGTCSGTYSGAQGTAAGQCTGGTLSSAWGAHATSIPAQDCFLNVMQGPPDGSGNVLNFDASLCYPGYGTRPASPTGLVATVH